MNTKKFVAAFVVVAMLATSMVSVLVAIMPSANASISQPVVPETKTLLSRGQFWNRYSDGSMDRDRFPINYWNDVESKYMPIDTSIYTYPFGGYYWKNAKNTLDAYFKQYSDAGRIKFMFYNVCNGHRYPSSVIVSYDNVSYRNDTISDDVLNRASVLGSKSGDTVTYNPFSNASEVWKVTRSGVENSIKFTSLPSPEIADVQSLVLSAEITKDASANIYIDGVLWNEVGKGTGERISFGTTTTDLFYELDTIKCFDSVMMYSGGTYEMEKVGGDVYAVDVVVPYSFVQNATFPLVVDPNWWATTASLLDLGYNNEYNSGSSSYVWNGGVDERYNEGIGSGTTILGNSRATLTPGSLTETQVSYYDYEEYSVDTPLPASNIYSYSNVGGNGNGGQITDDAAGGMYLNSWGVKTEFGYNSHDSIPPACNIRDNLNDVDNYDSFAGYKMRFGIGSSSQSYSVHSYMTAYAWNNQGTRFTLFSLEHYVFHTYDTTWHNYAYVYLRDSLGTLLDTVVTMTEYSSYGNEYVSWMSEMYVNYTAFDYSGDTFELEMYYPYIDEYGSYVSPVWYNNSAMPLATACENVGEVGFYMTGDYGGQWYSHGHYFTYDNVRVLAYVAGAYTTSGVAYSNTIDARKQYRVKDTSEQGFIYRWDYLYTTDTQPINTDLKTRVEYYTGAAWALIPDVDLPGNSVGFDGDGIPVTIDMSELDMTTYYMIRVKFSFSTTDTASTSTLTSWVINAMKGVSGGAGTASVSTSNIALEAPVTTYNGNGNIIVGMGSATWAADPYMRCYWKRATSQPDVNDAGWTTISIDMATTPSVPGSWNEITDDDNIRIVRSQPNNGALFSYLWFPYATTSSYTDYWFKVVITDTQWGTGDIPTRALFMITSAQASIFANNYPVADAGADFSVPALTAHIFDADLINADGNIAYGIDGIDALATCNWSFEQTVGGTWSVYYNRTVTTQGDGMVSISFPDDGTYVATLELVDVHGLIDVDVATITVTNAAPVVDWVVEGVDEPYQLGVERDYYYDASDSVDVDGEIVSYNWSWGDGNWTNKSSIDDGWYVHYSYGDVGNFTVTLYCTDDDGLSAYLDKDVEILVGVPIAVIADEFGSVLSKQTTTATLGERITLSGGSSSAGSGTIDEYAWDWGDGNNDTTSASVTSHIYTIEGTYYVLLTVTSSYGYSDTTYCYVRVEAGAAANLTDFIGLGANPRFEYRITDATTNLTLDDRTVMLKDGWGGSWFEKHVFKESIKVVIDREDGPLDDDNTTVTFEVFTIEAKYFDVEINTGDMKYAAGVWNEIYIYVEIGGAWTLLNIADASGVTVTPGVGELKFKFTEVWDSVVILTNPGFWKKLGYQLGGSTMTPDAILGGMMSAKVIGLARKEEIR